MTKEEFTKVMAEALGDSEYGKEVLADLVAHFDETGKYAQDAKDRLDERRGTLTGWAKKHEAEGNEAMAKEELAKVAIVDKALAALK